MDDINCEHCYPEKSYHVIKKIFTMIDYFAINPSTYILSKLFLLSENDFLRFDSLLNKLLTIILQKLKLRTKTNIIDRAQFNNTILALWDEAIKRGLEIYNFKELKSHTPQFLLIANQKKYYFIQTPIYLILQKNINFDYDITYDNKWIFKKKLISHDIPCPEGKAFISCKNACKYGIKLGFPLAVKPLTSSLSIHVSYNIKNLKELKKAIKVVKQVDCRVLIEKHIPGNVYRALIVNNTLIACAMRQPGYVIGDGVSSISKLIENNKLATHKETNDIYLKKIVEAQRVTLDTIIDDGQQIFISKKVTFGSGAKITNVMDLIHPKNKLLLERTHQILNLPLTGLDFICEDISIPWQKQQFKIIENNSFPYIELHHNPSECKPINVAGKIWDYVLDNLKEVPEEQISNAN